MRPASYHLWLDASLSRLLFARQPFALPLHGRTPSLDCLSHNRLRVFNELAALVQRLVHDLGGCIGQFMDTPFGSGVARLVVDPFSYWIYTSAPDDNKLIQTVMAERGLTYEGAAEELLKREGSGRT